MDLNNQITSDWTGQQRVGLVSFLYNHPVNQKEYLRRINHEPERFKANLMEKATTYIYIGGVRQGGLTIRRKQEYEMIFL